MTLWVMTFNNKMNGMCVCVNYEGLLDKAKKGRNLTFDVNWRHKINTIFHTCLWSFIFFWRHFFCDSELNSCLKLVRIPWMRPFDLSCRTVIKAWMCIFVMMTLILQIDLPNWLKRLRIAFCILSPVCSEM